MPRRAELDKGELDGEVEGLGVARLAAGRAADQGSAGAGRARAKPTPAFAGAGPPHPVFQPRRREHGGVEKHPGHVERKIGAKQAPPISRRR